MDWLEKLREAKALLEGLAGSGADLMDKAADVNDLITKAIRDGAALLRGAGTLDAGQYGRAEALKAECEESLALPRAAAGGAWFAILMPLIIKAIEEFLKNRRPA